MAIEDRPPAVGSPPPDDEDLVQVVEALSRARTAAQVFDHDGRLRWVSEELLLLAGADRGADVGVGRRVEQALDGPVWRSILTAESLDSLRDELRRRLDPGADRPSIWVAPVRLRLPGRNLGIGVLGLTLRRPDGGPAGTALLYAPTLPARVVALVSEGDETMLTRMANLVRPGRRPAAVLFADIDSSAVLSRHLPTPAYFDLIREVTTTFDDLVADQGGITGKHAGDGASAFFLSENLGSDSAAAEAALRTAQTLPGAVRDRVDGLAAAGPGSAADGLRLNVGVHWGANLYIGQIVTGGRLEVTALGDEVNECARIEQTAIGGQTLASKTLIERLDDPAADRLRLPPRSISYRLLAELNAGAKATRDAGTIPVTDLASRQGTS